MELEGVRKEQHLEFQHIPEDDIDDVRVRGTRPLFNIYKRCNVVIFQPTEFRDVEKDDKWIKVMKDEIRMIEKK